MAALTVMNMLVGVLCEVVSAVAASEREEINLSYVKAKIERIFTELGLDENNNKMISKEEFVKLLDNREAAHAIQDLGVDVVGLVDFAEVFFTASDDDEAYSKELSFAEFMDAVVALRGSNVASVKDIIDLRKIIMESMSKQERQVQDILHSMHGNGQDHNHHNHRASQAKNVGLRPLQDALGMAIHNGAHHRLAFRQYEPSIRPVTPVTKFQMDPGLSVSEVQQDEKLRSAADCSAVPFTTASTADVGEEAEDASQELNSSWQASPLSEGKKFSRPMAWD